jgi:hypothetical protein
MRLQGKYVQPVVMAGIMAFLMTAFITWFNLGFRPDFVWLWLKAFVVAWPLASGAAFIAGPVTPRITLAILRAAERLR